MTVKKPTEILEEEHRIIEKVLKAIAALFVRVEADGNIAVEELRNIVEFMQIFSDKCHHGKEEAHLFPLLEKRGVPVTGCPVAILINEHEKGRTLVKQLLEAGTAYANEDKSVKPALLKTLKGLMDLYPNHIWKEEYLLFPMTNKVLSEEDQKSLAKDFEAVEEEIGREVHSRLARIAGELPS